MLIKRVYSLCCTYLHWSYLLLGISVVSVIAVGLSAFSGDNYPEIQSTLTYSQSTEPVYKQVESMPLYDDPTATWEPLYKTPTTAPTKDYTCPGYLPTDWLTVTPDLYWLWGCSNCFLTMTAHPTMTGMYSPTPSETPVPTGTPTSTPTNWGVLFSQYSKTNAVTGSPYVTGSGSVSCSANDNIWVPTFSCDFSFSCSSSSQYVGGDCRSTVYIKDVYTTPSPQRIYFKFTGTGLHWWQDNSDNKYIDIPHQGYDDFVYNEARYYRLGITIPPLGNGSYTAHMEFQLRPFAPNTPTPTPVTTPIVSECSIVRGSTSEDDDILPIIVVGPESCAKIWGFSIDTSWLGGNFPDTIGLPDINLCVREISFGSIKLFGLSISLDILATILTGAMVLRWFLRS